MRPVAGVNGADASGKRAAVNGDESAIRAFNENARDFIALLRGHIDKEDAVLFRMADNVLDHDICGQPSHQLQADRSRGRGATSQPLPADSPPVMRTLWPRLSK